MGPKPAGFDDANRAATINLSTPAGRHYESSMKEQVYHRLLQSGLQCLIDGPGNPQRAVTILFRIDASGQPVESLLWPRTDFGVCAHGGIGPFTLSPPPRDDYWVKILLRP
ncbi:MAG: hypothetical protein HKP30_05470 [Myxococcales bacterium]|nr:hypothetical protein [Myxococcales bacterium]